MRVPRAYIIGPDNSFHKIWRAHNEEFLLQSHKDKHAYLQALHDDYMKKCSREDFVIYVYCLMSNHGHEQEKIIRSLKAFSEHMRRAHGKFGLCYNRRHNRLGKVAHDRPRTIRLQTLDDEMTCAFYILCNPVRAKIIGQPYDIRWKDFSTARYMAYGEKNRYTDMITLPEWYLMLGDTPEKRRRKFRQLLDEYLVEKGMKRDPRLSSGYFYGKKSWLKAMRAKLREKMREKFQKLATGPPDIANQDEN
jgi:REP element-mobilizing transposase RayT